FHHLRLRRPFLSVLLSAPPTTASYPLSLHDALPISRAIDLDDRGGDKRHRAWRQGHRRGVAEGQAGRGGRAGAGQRADPVEHEGDRKSTRLNSSHVSISYAVFCFKKNIQNKPGEPHI